MKSDDRAKKDSGDRSKLLEEIRRRAEEAELKRIEEEEQDRRPSQKGPASKPPAQAPNVPASPAEPPVPPPTAVPPEPPAVPSQPAPSQQAPAARQPEPESARAKKEPTQTAPVTAVKPGASETVRSESPSQQAPRTPEQEPPPASPPPPTQRAPRTEKDPSTVKPEGITGQTPFPAPFPVPSGEGVVSTAKIAREQRIAVLRERLGIALDRSKIEKAADLLSELGTLVEDQNELGEYRTRLAEARGRKEAAKEKKAPPPESKSKPKEKPPEDRAQREARKKRMAELLENADSLYQAEKYERSLQVVNEILEADDTNEEAKRLREAIQKAQELAFKIQQEETRRKAEEAATYAPPPPAAPKPKDTDKDFWGTSTAASSDVGYELPPEEKGPVGPPKQPTLDRLVTRVAKIKVSRRPLLIAGGVLIVALIAYLVVDNLQNTVAQAKYSLLVLPATPLANDTTFTWIADGISEDLIRDLSSLSDLRVIGAPTALSFRSATMTAPQLARSVGANYFLQWSILRAPDGVVVQPNLYDTLSAPAVWVNKYQMSMRELPGIRFELVRRLAAAMNMTISADEEEAFRRYHLPDPSTYNLYLRARHMLRQPELFDPATIIQTLEQATQADSEFVDAQTALGWAHLIAYEEAPEVVASHLAEASVCVQRAISLGARSAETFRVWGLIDQWRSQYDKAVDRLEQAVTISPTDAESQRRLAVAYVVRNRLDGALRAAQRAADDDPGNLDSYTVLGLILQFRGDYSGALHTYEQGLRFARDRSEYASGFYADALVYVQQPERASDILHDRLARVRQSAVDYYKLGRIEQSAGKPKQEWQGAFLKAKALLQERLAAEPRDAVALSDLALVDTRLGEFKEALASNSRAQQLAPNDIMVLYNTARMYAVQRDKTQALEYLSKAINRRYSLAGVLDMDFHNLRSEPEFLTAITR